MAIDGNEERSPFTRPGFIVAAVVVALIAVAGIVIAIVSAMGGDSEPDPASPSPSSSSPSAVPSPEPSADAGGASVCGLSGEELSGTLSIAPETQWEYHDTMAYPTSEEFGPGATSPEGVRYCFQHSPEGAVFAAANAVVQGSSPDTASAWIAYFLSEEAPGRDEMLSSESGGTPSDTRVSIAAFRVLSYDGDAARVDIAVRGVTGGNEVYGSAIFDLVWEAGDWKLLPQNTGDPLRLAQIPDTSGYIVWEE